MKDMEPYYIIQLFNFKIKVFIKLKVTKKIEDLQKENKFLKEELEILKRTGCDTVVSNNSGCFSVVNFSALSQTLVFI